MVDFFQRNLNAKFAEEGILHFVWIFDQGQFVHATPEFLFLLTRGRQGGVVNPTQYRLGGGRSTRVRRPPWRRKYGLRHLISGQFVKKNSRAAICPVSPKVCE